ncbi:MAG: metallophosphoesterase, partial [Caldilineaceae bacterium]|nr:metallophosphoesterase [Caldilineaceae bacterium]
LGYARYAEPQLVRVDNVTLPIAGLPAALAGKRFAQISDIHVGAYFAAEGLAAAIERVNGLDVDFLMLTGDFATVREENRSRRAAARTAALQTLVEPLRRAQMPIYAITGNHDMWGGLEPVEQMLSAAGAPLLRNRAIPIDSNLWLAGVDDLWGGQPDLQAAMRAVPSGAVTLLMAHAPDYFDTVLNLDAPVAAQFSGHTHGGQVRLPFVGPILTSSQLGRRYVMGHYHEGRTHLYVSRGLGLEGMSAPRVRFLAPPELTLITISQSTADQLA